MSSNGSISRPASPIDSIDFDIDLDQEFPALQQRRQNMAVENANPDQHLPTVPMAQVERMHIDDERPVALNPIERNMPKNVRPAAEALPANQVVGAAKGGGATGGNGPRPKLKPC